MNETREREMKMSKATKAAVKAELAALVRVASGEEANGVRLGDAGVTLEWLAGAVRARREMLDAAE